MKTRNVDLVQPDNEAYRKQSARYAQESRKLRSTLESSVLQHLSGPIEVLLRRWLSRRIPLTERRILRYERLQRTGDYDLRFKEIDAVQVVDSEKVAESEGADSSSEAGGGDIRPLRLFEFKCSSNPGTLSSASGQLRKAMRPSRTRWQQPVYRHAILVAVVPEVMDLRVEPVPLEEFDPSIPEESSPDDLLKTYLSAEGLWEWGRETNLIAPDGPVEAEPNLLSEAQEEAEAIARRRQKRKKLKEEGVPREDWPDELKTDSSEELPKSETVRYGKPEEEEGRSTMAEALRDALDEED